MKINLPRRLLIEKKIDQLALILSRARNNLVVLAEDLGRMKRDILLLYTQDLDATAVQLKSIIERINGILADTSLPSQLDISATDGLIDRLVVLSTAVVDVGTTRPDATWKLVDIRDWMDRNDPSISYEETDTVSDLLAIIRQAEL